jgi:hypothetical protein
MLSTATTSGGSTRVEHQTETHTVEQEVLVWPIVVAGLVGLLIGGVGGYCIGQNVVFVDSTVGPVSPGSPVVYNTLGRVRHNRVYVPPMVPASGEVQLYDEVGSG